MNSITVAGTLGRDCELKQLNNGDTIANFSIADSMGKDKGTIWWNCTLYGKRAESLSQYLTKGQAVTVTGSVTEREWTDKEGAKRKNINCRLLSILRSVKNFKVMIYLIPDMELSQMRNKN
jgi:single-strand DNA-binding protein